MSLTNAKRLCPLCGKRMDGRVCPTDRAPTVLAEPYVRGSEDPIIGRVLSESYLVEGLLGEGGFGRVYEATQLTMDRKVALKTLHPKLVADQTQLARFYREAKAVSRLTSPHVVRVYDFGVDDGTGYPFLALELLRGRTLGRALLSEAPMDPLRVARIAEQVAQALAEAEHLGIVHRDLKPDNIFLLETHAGGEFVKVVDFGIAKMLEDGRDGKSNLTSTGVAIGTPLYMAPEQILGAEVDARADLYGLGCIIHEALLGAPPFSGERAAIVTSHLHSPAPSIPEILPSGVAAPEALSVLHDAMLEKAADCRPGSASVVVRVLAAVERGEEVDAAAMLAEAQADRHRGSSAAGSTRQVVVPGRAEGLAAAVPGSTPPGAVEEPRAFSPTQPYEGPAPAVAPADDTTSGISAVEQGPTGPQMVTGAGRGPSRVRALVGAVLLFGVLVTGISVWLSSPPDGTTPSDPMVSGPTARAGPSAKPGATDGQASAGELVAATVAETVSPRDDGAPTPESSPDAGAAVAPAPEAGTDSSAAGAPLVPPDAAPDGAEQDEGKDVGAPAPAPAPKAAKHRRPPRPLVSVAVSTKPLGATVHRGKRVVCKRTPCTFELRTSKRRLSLRFSLLGYDSRTRTFEVQPGTNALGTVRLVARPVP